MYYVYEWYIKDTDEIIYVGKGTRNRYKVRKHNKLFNEMIRRFECDSRIVKEFKTEKEAFDYEYERINTLKEKNECVCNIHKGGYGGSTEWWNEELRKRYSEKNVMKSEYQRERMSKSNPMKDPVIAEKTNGQKRKAVIIGDIEYRSIKEAHIALNVTTETIVLWCNKGINSLGQKCRYKGKPQVEYEGKRYNKGGSKSVVYQGIEYECVKDFAVAIGIAENTAHSWLRRGYNPDGIPCRYKNDNRELYYENRFVKRNKARAKTVIVNGIEYKSCLDASQKLNIPKTTLYSYLQGRKYNPKCICKYGNQQPSQGNTDKSTLKGPETNG